MSEISHFLTGEEISTVQLFNILAMANVLKKARYSRMDTLVNQHLALLFDKPSFRTRLSFTVAMRELGGNVIESVESSRKKESPIDQARVLNGYCHAIMVRTHEDTNLIQIRDNAVVPVINGLSNEHHPCQILADLMTLQEVFHTLSDLTLCYIGDGNNILHSLLLLAPPLGILVRYCCPKSRQPQTHILERALQRCLHATGSIQSFDNPIDAVQNAHAVYTDVWTSMGFETIKAEHLFAGFQVNENLMQHAHPEAVFLHCQPMERGKEVSHTLPDSECSVVFQQSENRLHAQKALLLHCLKGR